MSGMGMGGGDACKISMLWNWYTIDSCFLAESWHIRSSGAFAGSCIGVILLVMVLEALRRASREYEAFLIRKRLTKNPPASPARSTSDSDNSNEKTGTALAQPASCPAFVKRQFRPTLFEQLVRALLHMLQFAVAYFIMLLAMYFNGYIIICIFIGAFLGAFVFSWHNIALPYVFHPSSCCVVADDF
ncbi:hypothetical protein M409DRAFT_36929 [Zasmidium cellare ATCC 36951]|uniref:Copper transport protein n=1 Tax=Zasmidium cellare ATCC 36951 TaxID=1080233 RepID=A0A6A6CHS6_ZASCE|nr:uncharacterized protein M409DRAFT_36929 [Zasmidium cellare ATCC 36951]KAF2165502.1 hypothetical protein M409DRAFT_36929 [Zasmidium cellare ATCC 36951]